VSEGCPGQDRRTWTPDDIFEVPCAGCGAPVEFFKDDARRRCTTCGATNPNPRQAAGCASWCAAAEKCSVGRQWFDDGADDPRAIDEPA
jgi:hypothetical protein